jgi:hypothetical protein
MNMLGTPKYIVNTIIGGVIPVSPPIVDVSANL